MDETIADVQKNMDDFSGTGNNNLEYEVASRIRGYRDMSQATTATLRAFGTSRNASPTPMHRTQSANLFHHDADGFMNVDSEPAQAVTQSHRNGPSLVVATDFGTTYSSIAFAIRDGSNLPNIRVISPYPGDPMIGGHPSMQVPTESWYPTKDQMESLENAAGHCFSKNGHLKSETAESSDSEEDDEIRETTVDGGSLMDLDKSPDSDPSTKVTWGYGVQSLIRQDVDLRGYKRVLKSKLLLDASNNTQQARNELLPVLKAIKLAKKIKEDDDVIADFLACLFSHAKEQLARDDSIPVGIPIEHVLSVPVVWSAKACRRMQVAMENAITRTTFGTMQDLFFVSEPEAAAQYIVDTAKTPGINVGTSGENLNILTCV
jgi:hypothetical protein